MFEPIFSKKLSSINKICLSAVLIALVTILQKVVAINYISFIPFVRISFGGPALIILSSIWLGPFYGLSVGFFSDLFGYLIFDPKSFNFFPQITLIYALLGFASFFVFKLIKMIKNQKVLFIIQTTVFISLFVMCCLFVFLNDDIVLYTSTYHLELYHKFIIAGTLFMLSLALLLFVLIFSKKNTFNKVLTTYQLSFSLFIIEILVMVIFGSLMKASAFSYQTYGVILLVQILLLFFNIPLNTILISLFARIIEPSNIINRS